MSGDAFEPKRLTAPFSVSDVFVYIIPGAVLLLSVFFTEQFLKERAQAENVQFITPFGQMLWTWGMQVVAEPSLLYAVALLLVLITVTYVGGHLVSSISSFFVDRLLVHHGLQYPYTLFLGRRKDAAEAAGEKWKFFKPIRAKEAFYRGLFSWPLAMCFFWYCTPWFRSKGDWLGNIAPAAAGVCFAVTVFLAVGKVGWHEVQRRRANWFFGFLADFYDRRRLRLMWIAAGLYDLCHNTFSSVLSPLREPLAPGLLEEYTKRFRREFKIEPSTVGSLHFWFPYAYVMRYGQDFYRLLLMWHYQYEMARNIATSFFLAAIYSAWLILYRIPGGGAPPHWMGGSVFWLPLVFGIFSTIMLSRYYYIYVCYFNRSLFRAFVFVHQQRDKDPTIGHSALDEILPYD